MPMKNPWKESAPGCYTVGKQVITPQCSKVLSAQYHNHHGQVSKTAQLTNLTKLFHPLWCLTRHMAL